MSNPITARFHDELKNWEQTLVQHSQTIAALEKRLYAIIERNTIPHLADEAEELMDHLSLLGVDVQSLFHSIVEQQSELKKNSTAPEKDVLSEQAKTNQELIR